MEYFIKFSCIATHFFLYLIVLILVVGCKMESPKILEIEYTSFSEIAEVSTPRHSVTLSGLSLHSSLVVDKIMTVKDGEELQVVVYLKMTEKDFSGNFEHTVVIPPDVNKITFGGERSVVWERSYNKKAFDEKK